tara:strand:- start:1885 stop:2733 length:849 start_codon:yes stop_codon:yes gene_type:complete
MEIILGTVQFGQKYGISNQIGLPSDNDLTQIFSFAKKSGISKLDTSGGYGNAEKRIADFSNNYFKIITKFPNVNSADDISLNLKNRLKNLNKISLYGYLAHNPDCLISNPNLWNHLVGLKNKGEIEKIGYSVYLPTQLEDLLNLNFIPDIVQIPYSVFDRKFEKYFEKLKSLGTEIHVRSVFLQGFYFLNLNKIPDKLFSLKAPLKQFQEICQIENYDITKVLLDFVLQNKFIDSVVIGVESVKQLKHNIEKSNQIRVRNSVFNKIRKIKIKEEQLLNPTNW